MDFSLVRHPKDTGRLPVKLLDLAVRSTSELIFPTLFGSELMKQFTPISSEVTMARFPREEGMEPSSEFELQEKVRRATKQPTSTGSGPEKSLLLKPKYVSFVEFAIAGGISPLKAL